jgi:hypothetical protein
VFVRSYIKLPDYFKTHAQEDIFDVKKSPFAYAFNLESLTFFEVLSQDPKLLHSFNKMMSDMELLKPILGMYPFSSLEPQVEAEPDRAFVVDVGGGRGQSLLEIRKEAPGGFGVKMILQDRPDVVAVLAEDDLPDVEKMAYDFFTPQPIKSMSHFSSTLFQTPN